MAEETIILGNSNWAVKTSNLLGYAIGEISGKYVPRQFTFSRNSTATYVDNNGIIQTTSANIARVQENGLLIEPQRVNLYLRSEDFTSPSWSKSSITVTGNSIISPDGNTNGTLYLGDGTASIKNLVQSVSFTSGTVYTISIYAKKGSNNFLQITGAAALFGSTVFANYDLNNGVLGNIGTGTTGSIQNAGNGWYRCIMTATATTTGSGFSGFYLVSSETSVRGESNSLSTSVYVWGAQFEAGNYATSYIPTTAATVTRLQDSFNLQNIANLIGQTQGVIMLDFLYDVELTTSNEIFYVYNVSTQYLYRARIGANGTNIFAVIYSSGSSAKAFSPNITLVPGNRYKIASVYDYSTNNIKTFVNGSFIGTTIGVDPFPTASQDKIYSGNLFGAIQYTKFNGIYIFNQIISDSEAIQLTTI